MTSDSSGEISDYVHCYLFLNMQFVHHIGGSSHDFKLESDSDTNLVKALAFVALLVVTMTNDSNLCIHLCS